MPGSEDTTLRDDATSGRVPETILEGTTCDSISDALCGLERVSCLRPPSEVANDAVLKLGCSRQIARCLTTVTAGTSDAPSALAVTSSCRLQQASRAGLDVASGSATPAPRDTMRLQRSRHSVATVGTLEKEHPATSSARGRQPPLQKPDHCMPSVAHPTLISSAIPGDNPCRGAEACTPPGVVQQQQPENAAVASLTQPSYYSVGVGVVSRRQSLAGPRPLAHQLSRAPSLQHVSLNPHTPPLHASSWRVSRDAAALAVAAAALEFSAIARVTIEDPSSSDLRLGASGDTVSFGVGGYAGGKMRPITQREGGTTGGGKAVGPITGRRASK